MVKIICKKYIFIHTFKLETEFVLKQTLRLPTNPLFWLSLLVTRVMTNHRPTKHQKQYQLQLMIINVFIKNTVKSYCNVYCCTLNLRIFHSYEFQICHYCHIMYHIVNYQFDCIHIVTFQLKVNCIYSILQVYLSCTIIFDFLSFHTNNLRINQCGTSSKNKLDQD